MKIVIFKQSGKIFFTPEENYNSVIRDGCKINKCTGFKSCEQVAEYLTKYNGLSKEDIIIKEEE